MYDWVVDNSMTFRPHSRAPERVSFLQPAQRREALDLKAQYATNGRALFGNESEPQCGRGVLWRAAHRVPNIEMATIPSLGSTHRGWSLSLCMWENPIMFLVFASSDRETAQATGECE
jgi:hypothetical protein